MINVHRHTGYSLPRLILVDTDKNCAAYASIDCLVGDYGFITSSDEAGWDLDQEVGEYISSYDEFPQKYPEYFI